MLVTTLFTAEMLYLVLLVRASEDVVDPKSDLSEAVGGCGCACRSYTIKVCRFTFTHGCLHNANAFCKEEPIPEEVELRISECQRCVATTQDFVHIRRLRRCYPVESEVCHPIYRHECVTSLDCSTTFVNDCYYEKSSYRRFCSRRPLKRCRRRRQCLPTPKSKCRQVSRSKCVLVPRHVRGARRGFKCEEFEPRQPDRPCPPRQLTPINISDKMEGREDDERKSQDRLDKHHHKDDHNDEAQMKDRYYDPQELVGIDYYVSDLDDDIQTREDKWPELGNDDDHNDDYEEWPVLGNDDYNEDEWPAFGLQSNRRIDQGELEGVGHQQGLGHQPRQQDGQLLVRKRGQHLGPRVGAQRGGRFGTNLQKSMKEQFVIWEELFDPEDLAHVDYYEEKQPLSVKQQGQQAPRRDDEEQLRQQPYQLQRRRQQPSRGETRRQRRQQARPRQREQSRQQQQQQRPLTHVKQSIRVDKSNENDLEVFNENELFDLHEVAHIEYFDDEDGSNNESNEDKKENEKNDTSNTAVFFDPLKRNHSADEHEALNTNHKYKKDDRDNYEESNSSYFHSFFAPIKTGYHSKKETFKDN